MSKSDKAFAFRREWFRNETVAKKGGISTEVDFGMHLVFDNSEFYWKGKP